MDMRSETGTSVFLKDYKAPDYLVDHVDLLFELDAQKTRVFSRLKVQPNPAGKTGAPLQFDGDGLDVLIVRVNGSPLTAGEAEISADQLIIHNPPQTAFFLETVTQIDAAANLAFSGLYISSGVFCTQCEAEGFRRITFFPDRPDILSTYRTKIIALKSVAPVLLGNGNPVEQGELPDGRHFAVWDDPIPKPCYLFALVGGKLGVLRDQFTTMSGRKVTLGIYVETGKESRAVFAMDALKRSMKWDEDVFAREYDLEVFNIVAVSDFNMGAMENKGLNIFNDKYILASAETATDADFENIEAIVAHEYFHNWTGNRITCRDWFQLCLKEGLTVYRDQEFSADQHSRTVKRIMDARDLQSIQFPEDAGPLAHNVRPESYREINNFYTATVYEKGAEVIRVLKLLIGEEAFARGMQLYFERCDGTAATVETFLDCFAESSGRNLDQFMRWYTQAGTPTLAITTSHDPAAQTFRVTLRQTTAPTAGQSTKLPFVIPVALGLASKDGQEIKLDCAALPAPEGASAHETERQVFELNTSERKIVFRNLASEPVLSALRNLSAPVKIEIEQSEDDLLILSAYDNNLYNRWNAIQTLAMRILKKRTVEIRNGKKFADAARFCSALLPALRNWRTDPAFTAQVLSLPSENDIARDLAKDVDPDAIYEARCSLLAELGLFHASMLQEIYDEAAAEGANIPDLRGSGFRALQNTALGILWHGQDDSSRALHQYRSASNMTLRAGALTILARAGAAGHDALADFEQLFRNEPLILDKWFAIQATVPGRQTLGRVESLMKHPAFNYTNPNRLRALAGSFCSANPTGFNALDGTGYRFLTKIVQDIDGRNPQVAARMLGALSNWRRLEEGRRKAALAALEHLAQAEVLSVDVRDILLRTIG